MRKIQLETFLTFVVSILLSAACTQRRSSSTTTDTPAPLPEQSYCVRNMDEALFIPFPKTTEVRDSLRNLRIVRSGEGSPHAYIHDQLDPFDTTIKALSKTPNCWQDLENNNHKNIRQKTCSIWNKSCVELHELLFRFIQLQLKEPKNTPAFDLRWKDAIRAKVEQDSRALTDIPQDLWVRLLLPEGRKQALNLAIQLQDIGQTGKAFYIYRTLAIVGTLLSPKDLKDLPSSRVMRGIVEIASRWEPLSTYAVGLIDSIGFKSFAHNNTKNLSKQNVTWDQIKEILLLPDTESSVFLVDSPELSKPIRSHESLTISKKFVLEMGMSLRPFLHPKHGWVYPAIEVPGTDPTWYNFPELVALQKKHDGQINADRSAHINFKCIAFYPPKKLLFCNVSDEIGKRQEKISVFAVDEKKLQLVAEKVDAVLRTVYDNPETKDLLIDYYKMDKNSATASPALTQFDIDALRFYDPPNQKISADYMELETFNIEGKRSAFACSPINILDTPRSFAGTDILCPSEDGFTTEEFLASDQTQYPPRKLLLIPQINLPHSVEMESHQLSNNYLGLTFVDSQSLRFELHQYFSNTRDDDLGPGDRIEYLTRTKFHYPCEEAISSKTKRMLELLRTE